MIMETQQPARQLHARLSRQKHARLNRLWRLTELLSEARRGSTVAQLLAQIDVSRATIYRDIEMLEHVGVVLNRETVNGEVRYRLATSFSLNRAALVFARTLLAPLADSSLIDVFDRASSRLQVHPSSLPVRAPSMPAPPAGHSNIVNAPTGIVRFDH